MNPLLFISNYSNGGRREGSEAVPLQPFHLLTSSQSVLLLCVLAQYKPKPKADRSVDYQMC